MNKIWKLQVFTKISENFQNKYPKTSKILHRTKNGMQALFNDTRTYMRVKKTIAKNEDITISHTWDELIVYKQIPNDLKQVAPIILLSTLPLFQYIIIPLAYLNPTKLLSQQFWASEHRMSVFEVEHKKRLILKNSFVGHLAQFTNNEKSDAKLKNLFIDMLDKFQNNQKIETLELLDLKQFFIHNKLDIQNLSPQHAKDLSLFHGCSSVFDIKIKNYLESNAFIMLNIDKCLPIEHDVISNNHMFRLAHDRGLEVNKKNTQEMSTYLKNWIFFSKQLFNTNTLDLQRQHYSLYLHAAILLSQNYFAIKEK